MQEWPEDLVLEEVAPDRKLVQEMENFLPHSHQLVSMVLLHLRYQHFPLMRARVFIPQSALFRYKMFVVTNIATAEDLSSMSLFWSKDHLSDGNVRQLLKSLPGFNWKGTILICQLPLHLHQNLDHIIRGLSECSLVVELSLPVKIFTVGNSTHEIPSLPEGYYAGPLKESHGPKVLTGWVGENEENEEVFSRILEHLPAVGIFKTRKLSPKPQKQPGTSLGIEIGAQTNCLPEFIPGRMIGTDSGSQSHNALECITAATADGEVRSFTADKNKCSIASVPGCKFTCKLNVPDDTPITRTDMMDGVSVANSKETNDSQDELVGWCVLKQGADIGMTYTTKGHRKLGLAKVATLKLMHHVLNKQLNAFAMVLEDNAISIVMHEKLGFKEYTTDIILMYSPKKCNRDDTSEEVQS